MQWKSIIAAAAASVCLLTGTLPCTVEAAPAEEAHISALDGSFIQPWLYYGWDDTRWEAEMQVLKETGIDTLIMGDVANQNADDTWTVFYPSELDFLDGYLAYNAVDSFMYYCDKYDIKVYLGMGLDCNWNSDLTTEEGLSATREYMARCNQITTELYNRYKEQYPDTYEGFYFVTELYNTIYMDTELGLALYTDGMDEMFTAVIDHCTALNPDMPIIFSPYVNIFGYGFASINLDRFTEFWTSALTKIPFRDGDMLCPQDSCGGGGNDLTHVVAWTRAYRNAVDRANAIRGTKLLLGTNAELFVSPDASRMSNPHGVSYVGIKTVSDFASRLEKERPYVDSLFCFAYSHHYSPYNVPEGYHAAFTEYLKTGEIETNAPTPPHIVRTECVLSEGEQHLQIQLAGMTDDTDVGQIDIYKDGFFYDYIVPGVNNNQTGLNKHGDTWIDYEFDVADVSERAVYEFEVYDVCGNVSERVSYEITHENTSNGADLNSVQRNVSPAVTWSKTPLDYLSYTVTAGGVRINGCDKTVEEIIIPDMIEGVPVTVIDWYAFQNCQNLRSVTLPETVTHISRFAFAHCINLERVNMPSSLYAIEQYAFHDCPKLTEAALPESLRILEERAFSGCTSLQRVNIPVHCERVGEYAFLDCTSLPEMRIDSTNTVYGTKSIGYRYDGERGYVITSGFMMDVLDGTGKTYAEENGIPLKGRILYGDVNADGVITLADAVRLQRYLVGTQSLRAEEWICADMSESGTISVLDLALLKAVLHI